MRDQATAVLATDEIQDRIREAVQGHLYLLTTAFTDLDFAGIGAITKDDFKDVFAKNIMRCTDEQVITSIKKKLLHMETFLI